MGLFKLTDDGTGIARVVVAYQPSLFAPFLLTLRQTSPPAPSLLVLIVLVELELLPRTFRRLSPFERRVSGFGGSGGGGDRLEEGRGRFG